MILLSKSLLPLDHMQKLHPAEQKENTFSMFVLSKAIDKPTRQDNIFLTLGCLAACEDIFSHIPALILHIILFFYLMQNGQWHELQPRNYNASVTRAV